MKKLFIVMSVTAIVIVSSQCSTTKKVAAAEAPKSTYTSQVQTVIMSHCSPCHIPDKGGKKKAYDNYANVKSDIDDIIRRIELNPTDRGFMPFKGAKLHDSTIAVFKQWKADGMLEK